jgi:hypothetical protein
MVEEGEIKHTYVVGTESSNQARPWKRVSLAMEGMSQARVEVERPN